MSVRIFAALVLSALSFGLQAEALNESYAFALLGEPKYATDFSHFDYVNPAAPKGGDVRLAAIGTYDNFNRFATRGVPGERTDQLYDTLFATSDDEPGSFYPLIAESARFPADMRWV
ncbi:ABC transporter substrate-binding protein, partial [Serratia marcescens]